MPLLTEELEIIQIKHNVFFLKFLWHFLETLVTDVFNKLELLRDSERICNNVDSGTEDTIAY
jgi:hypothetical protein